MCLGSGFTVECKSSPGPLLDTAAAACAARRLVQELCDCGTLASIAASYWSRDTEDDMQMLQRLLLLQDVVRGLEFLHSKNIVHSDLVKRSPALRGPSHASRLCTVWQRCPD